MPIAKTAVKEVQKEVKHEPAPPVVASHDNVPYDIYAKFGVDFNASVQTKDRLREIYEWAKDGSETIGDALMKISDLESQLGYSGFDKLHDKMWNYIRLDKHVKELEKRKQSMRKRWL